MNRKQGVSLASALALPLVAALAFLAVPKPAHAFFDECPGGQVFDQGEGVDNCGCGEGGDVNVGDHCPFVPACPNQSGGTCESTNCVLCDD